MAIKASVDIVIPVFNEEAIIDQTMRVCVEHILARFEKGRILVVDDASTDSTRRLLRKWAAKTARITVLQNARNRGHGFSLRRGLDATSADWVFCIDADNQLDPRDFWQLYRAAGDSDVVTGIRRKRHDPRYRRHFSDLGNRILRLGFRCPLVDLNVPFKLFRGPLLHRLLPRVPTDALIPSTLLLLAAHTAGRRIRQLPIRHFPRTKGRGSLPGKRFIAFAANSFVELIRFRIRLHEQRSTTAI